MSDKFPESSGKQPLSLEKCLENSNIDQSWCFNKEKNETVCFPGRFESATIQLSQGKNTACSIWPQIQGLPKHGSLEFQS